MAFNVIKKGVLTMCQNIFCCAFHVLFSIYTSFNLSFISFYLIHILFTFSLCPNYRPQLISFFLYTLDIFLLTFITRTTYYYILYLTDQKDIIYYI